jgi:beta-phosphoglucomutase
MPPHPDTRTDLVSAEAKPHTDVGFDAVLFDYDGVLVDSEELHFQAAAAAVQDLVGLELTRQDYAACFAGRRDEDAFKAFLAPRARHGEDPEGVVGSVLERRARYYGQLARLGLRACEGALDLVATLAGRVPLGLVTGSSRAEVHLGLELVGLAGRFDSLVCAEDVSEGKPSPAGYRQAAASLGVAPRRCLVMEDSPAGVAAAAAADMACVAVTTTHGAAELDAARLVVASLGDLDVDGLQGLGGA